MDELAEFTWERVAFADAGFSFREDSITEHNLFDLARRHPQLLVQRFNGTEEAANGADWEWWVGGPGQGWVGLRVQAKKLATDGTYHEIAHTTARRQRQYDLLIEACLDDEANFAAPILPLYCFYNGWHVPGGKAPEWPEDTKNAACPNDILPPKCRHVLNIRHLGCAITTALDVAAVHQGPHGRRTTLNGHLSRSRPWSHLFHEGRPLATSTAARSRPATIAAQVLRRASEWIHEGYEAATGNPNYDRLSEAVLRPPARELPPYANALLNGQLPRAAEWPQATFVAVLNVEAAG
ncbi:hypothetical protein KBX53_02905 [Micromonospora sp. M51]|uniref:DUF6615 family protein n=1 Tax=Micromonospora sp. M51 TaxID=2824889 RepID=UPI001B372093|nr:DUF6615 family protein [Micromonospora sp. M51]MBQ1009915.1 hypothetical protein [Micromonospora sp. M51]